jgi:hypothetical protein
MMMPSEKVEQRNINSYFIQREGGNMSMMMPSEKVEQRNINSYFIQREGGRLYGITKTGQHEYDDAI